uniref:Uncharacterized protein n=1 Tax=Magallana gigas TaxID=29159 RepID=K1RFM1_MAGGI
MLKIVINISEALFLDTAARCDLLNVVNPTMSTVSVECPTNETSWMQRSASYGCTNPQEYHCLPTIFLNKSEEYCFTATLVQQDPSCQKINPAKQCYLADSSCPNITSNDPTVTSNPKGIADPTASPGGGGISDAGSLSPLVWIYLISGLVFIQF